jgi:hypothetical protein
MVAELLRDFVAGPWLDDLDLEGMERQNAKFHAETGDRREGDMIWRIPRRDGGDTYLVLLLEFQSTPYHWMALRVLVYASLLWQQLLNEKSLLPDGRLPPILPVVLYNGDRRWAAPLAMHELVGLPANSPLWQWQPAMSYQIVDEGAFPEDDLARRDALLALLFRLESSPDPEQVVVLADALLAWFSRHPGFEGVRSVFAELLGAIMEPLAPGVRVPEELLEVRNMLASRAEDWKRQWLQEGELKGRQEGELKGRQEGELKGRQEGEERGEERGRRKGEAAILIRQLERRFGALPGWATERIATADTAALEEWSLRVFDATSLDEVLR